MGIQVYHWGLIAGLIMAGLLGLRVFFRRIKKKNLPEEISNYILISEERAAASYKLLLKYFDGIKVIECPIRENDLLEIKPLGILTEGALQIILLDEYGVPIKVIKNVYNHTLKFMAQKNGKFIIKLIGYHAKGKFGIECTISTS